MIGTRSVHVEMSDAQDVESPRQDEGNLGVLVMKHGRLNVPAEGDLVERIGRGLAEHSLRAVTRWLKVCHGATMVLPVYGYDHGQVRFKASEEPSYPFDDPWDGSLAGLIYDTPATREAAGLSLDNPATVPLIEAALTAEVDAYDKWANNELWRFEIREVAADGFEVIDSCGGYYSEQEARDAGTEAMPPVPSPEQVAQDTILHALRRAHVSARSTEVLAGVAAVAYWETIVGTNHPMHVADDAPHWHVRHGAEDNPDHIDATVFGALEFAGTELEAAAEREHDVFAARSGPGLPSYAEAYAAHDRSDRYSNLAENAKRLHKQATLPTWQRAPRYAGPDEAENRRLLLQAAHAHVERIHDGGHTVCNIWECAEADCDQDNDQ